MEISPRLHDVELLTVPVTGGEPASEMMMAALYTDHFTQLQRLAYEHYTRPSAAVAQVLGEGRAWLAQHLEVAYVSAYRRLRQARPADVTHAFLYARYLHILYTLSSGPGILRMPEVRVAAASPTRPSVVEEKAGSELLAMQNRHGTSCYMDSFYMMLAMGTTRLDAVWFNDVEEMEFQQPSEWNTPVPWLSPAVWHPEETLDNFSHERPCVQKLVREQAEAGTTLAYDRVVDGALRTKIETERYESRATRRLLQEIITLIRRGCSTAELGRDGVVRTNQLMMCSRRERVERLHTLCDMLTQHLIPGLTIEPPHTPRWLDMNDPVELLQAITTTVNAAERMLGHGQCTLSTRGDDVPALNIESFLWRPMPGTAQRIADSSVFQPPSITVLSLDKLFRRTMMPTADSGTVFKPLDLGCGAVFISVANQDETQSYRFRLAVDDAKAPHNPEFTFLEWMGERVYYRVAAIVIHTGPFGNSTAGHYTCVFFYKDEWYFYDDTEPTNKIISWGSFWSSVATRLQSPERAYHGCITPRLILYEQTKREKLAV